MTKPDSDSLKTEGALQGVSKSETQSLKAEFRVPKCDFINEAGEIIKPPHEMLSALGPRVQRWLPRMPVFMDNERRPLTRMQKFVYSMPFKTMTVLVITANYFFIIAQTNHRMANLNAEEPEVFRGIDLAFTGFYTFEVGISIIALKWGFFFGPDSAWNWFDFIIVFFSLLQESLAVLGISAADFKFLRILRFLRISKILRMFEAMRMFKEVKIMVDSLSGSFMVFAWCAVMMGLYLSVFAIFFVQGLTTKLEDDASANLLPPKLKLDIDRDFGDVVQSMVSLFFSLTGGVDYVQYYRTVKELGFLYESLFFFFLLFALMSFFNVVTGVFCEKAMSLARPGPRELLVKRRLKEVQDAGELIFLMKQILHVENAPGLTPESFDEFLTHPEVVTYFEIRGLNPSSMHRFFQVMVDINESDHIDFATFVSACVKLDGSASSIDMHVLTVELKACQLSLHHLHKELHDELIECIAKLSTTIQGVAQRKNGVDSVYQAPQENYWTPPPMNLGTDIQRLQESFFEHFNELSGKISNVQSRLDSQGKIPELSVVPNSARGGDGIPMTPREPMSTPREPCPLPKYPPLPPEPVTYHMV